MSIDELEFDAEFQDSNRTYSPPSEDKLAKTLEAMELNEMVRQGGQSVPVERYKTYEMEKAILGDFQAETKQESIPEGEAFDLAITKAAARLSPGESAYLFGNAILVKKAFSGDATWQRVKQ